MKKILITGCAGFIGFHLTKKLIELKNYEIIGIDNINSYYDTALKKKRLKILKKLDDKKFKFLKKNLEDSKLDYLFKRNKFDIIVNLAAQAGVRYSVDNPDAYFNSNLKGFYNLIDTSRKNKIKHFIYASTSSVYGDNKKFPLKEEFNTDKPLSFYAATKKCNEVIAYSYSNIFKLPTTGLRFFTVYGPYGRPDMSLFKFVKGIVEKKTIHLNNNGKHIRDFTYIDDVVNYIIRILNKKNNNKIPYQVLNIANAKPEKLKYFLSLIEKNLKKKAKVTFKKLQKGDVYKTFGSNKQILKITKYKPKIDIKSGINKFIVWYRNYYQ
jgi:UDP-glucuronate 4-epimerase